MSIKMMLTLNEVADQLGISTDDVRDLISCGDLSAVGSEKSYIRKCDLDKFLGIDNTPVSAPYTIAEDISEEEFNLAITNYGEGSVYWNNKRNCYQAAFYIVLPDGTKKRKIVSGTTEVEAIGKMQLAKSAVSSSMPLATPVIMVNNQDAKPNVKFSTVASEYMKINRKQVTDNTFRNKESLLKPLIDYFGNMLIDDIEPENVQSFLDEFQYFEDRSLRSRASIRNTYTLLKSIFNYAKNKKRPYIDNSPVYGVVMPKGVPCDKNSKFYTKDELVDIFRACLTHNKYRTIAVLALGTGLRSEEFTALKWSDIDFNKKKLVVDEAFVVKANSTGKTKWTRALDVTKTKSSTREEYFGDTVSKQLLEWKHEIQRSDAYKKALANGTADFVFIDANGNATDPDHLRHNFKMYFERREITSDKTITFHKFRHSFATWARSLDIDPFIIKTWMGHSMSGDITNGTYISVTNEMAEKASSIIDSFIANVLELAVHKGGIENPRGRNGKLKVTP